MNVAGKKESSAVIGERMGDDSGEMGRGRGDEGYRADAAGVLPCIRGG